MLGNYIILGGLAAGAYYIWRKYTSSGNSSRDRDKNGNKSKKSNQPTGSQNSQPSTQSGSNSKTGNTRQQSQSPTQQTNQGNSTKTGTRPRNVTQGQSSGQSHRASGNSSSTTTQQSPTAQTSNEKAGNSTSGHPDSTGARSGNLKNSMVQTEDGEQIKLCKKIEGGKEGIVYSSGSSAVKIYKQERWGDDELEEKIRTMIKSAPSEIGRDDHQWFAWPEEVIFYQDDFVGFSMPLIDTDKFNNIKRYIKQELSKSGVTETKLKLSYNLSTVVSFVHQQGHAVGDFNFKNILVKDTKVTMIDCDAYSICDSQGREFHGETMFEQTVPPEGRPTDTIQQAQLADNFNLAKWIFRIMTGGMNPYQAKGTLATVDALVEMMEKNPFPYWNPKSGLIEPTVGQSEYNDQPPELRLLFESAFLGGKFHPFKRPSPRVWKDIIRQVYERKQTSSVKTRTQRNQLPENLDSGTARGKRANFDKMSTGNNIGSIAPRETKFISLATIRSNTGSIGLSFSGKDGVVAARSFHPGLTMRVTGTVVTAPKFRDVEREIRVDDYDMYPHFDNYNGSIAELEHNSFDVHVRGIIVGIGNIRSAQKRGVNKVLRIILADQSGYSSVDLRDAMAERLEKVPIGLTLEIVDGRVSGSGTIIISESNKLGALIPPIATEINVLDGNITDAIDTESLAPNDRGNKMDLRGTVDDCVQDSSHSDQLRKIDLEVDGDIIEIDITDEFKSYGIELGQEVYLFSIKVTESPGNNYRGKTRPESVITIIE